MVLDVQDPGRSTDTQRHVPKTAENARQALGDEDLLKWQKNGLPEQVRALPAARCLAERAGPQDGFREPPA
jgi:hypothetical protein